MITKLPTTMLSDGTPSVVFGRGVDGNNTEYLLNNLRKKNWGMTTFYQSANIVGVAKGQRFGNGKIGAMAADVTKDLTTLFTAGDGNGSLDTGAITNNCYYVHLIQNTTTNVCDVLTSLSANSPTIPSGWVRITRLGAFIRRGGAVEPYVQIGNMFQFLQPIKDLDVVYQPAPPSFQVVFTAPDQIEMNLCVTCCNSAPSTANGAYDWVNVTPSIGQLIMMTANGRTGSASIPMVLYSPMSKTWNFIEYYGGNIPGAPINFRMHNLGWYDNELEID